MKKFKYIIRGILAPAVVGVLCLQSCGGGERRTAGNVCPGSDSASFRLPVAYVRTDSLLNNYRYCIDLNESLMKEIEDQRLKLGQRQQKFQKEVEEFQRKLQLNAYISRERASQEEQRLGKQQEELSHFAASIQEEFSRKQAIVQQQLQDTILNRIREFNTPKRYDMIFSNIGSDNFFYIDESYDITKEVIDFLNANYKPESK
ncbi:MAG: OmpH family outer membrane protein [Dysgonamonadaceae bacterium]|jgi:outer membrane protein|nr:OmpH family outer membrane protein [Dysgonamonadaceae bacterium]